MNCITFTSSDFKNAVFNGVCVSGYVAIGDLMVSAIIKIAHKVFKIQEDTYLSYTVRGGAFLVSAATIVYFDPKLTLIPLTKRVVVELFLSSIITSVALKGFTKRDFTPLLSVASGAVAGYFNPTLTVCGIMAAANAAMDKAQTTQPATSA